MNKNILIGILVVVGIAVVGLIMLMNRGPVPIYTPQPVVTEEEPLGEEEHETSALPIITLAPSPVTTPTAVPVASQTALKEFTVTASNFKFDPSQIQVKKGETVRIVFKNNGGSHDFRLDEFKASTKVIQGGQQETIEFVADKTGQFEYYCSVGNHRQMGMKGTLVVDWDLRVAGFGVDFVTGVLRFKEIDQLKDVSGRTHPLGRIFDVVMFGQTQLF